MEGIVAEGAEMIEEEGDDEVKDAGLIAAAQRVEHYEMAGYGTARTYAELLEDQEGAKLLSQTFEEEKQTDEKLSNLAKSTINVEAAAK
jgi:ferritin-like metal-binding protein YciE